MSFVFSVLTQPFQRGLACRPKLITKISRALTRSRLLAGEPPVWYTSWEDWEEQKRPWEEHRHREGPMPRVPLHALIWSRDQGCYALYQQDRLVQQVQQKKYVWPCSVRSTQASRAPSSQKECGEEEKAETEARTTSDSSQEIGEHEKQHKLLPYHIFDQRGCVRTTLHAYYQVSLEVSLFSPDSSTYPSKQANDVYPSKVQFLFRGITFVLFSRWTLLCIPARTTLLTGQHKVMVTRSVANANFGETPTH